MAKAPGVFHQSVTLQEEPENSGNERSSQPMLWCGEDGSNSERRVSADTQTITTSDSSDIHPHVETKNKTDARKSKLKKNKQAYVCVKFPDEPELGEDILEYLQQRLGDKFKYEFEVQDSETMRHSGGKNARVTLSFRSKTGAMKAMELFKQGNKNSPTKLGCYFSETKLKESAVLNTSEIQTRFERHLQLHFDRSAAFLDAHISKITKQKEIQDNLEKKQTEDELSIADRDCIEGEMKAIGDKLAELVLQKNEFSSYSEEIYKQLEEIKESTKFEIKVNELRMKFGIECNRLKNALPIYARRSDIVDAVDKHQVTVILGETGSGKSTQMVQYLHDAGYAKRGLIACTQPRKIAAVTVATHVASEMSSNVGQIIGYHVGMKAKKTSITKVVYMTDHILLNECLKDNQLKMYSCIIIDEAHERSIFTDLLLGMIKSALVGRPDLRVVITSATINPDIFVSYFGGPEVCPVVRVSGRTFPVEVIWLKEKDEQNPFADYANAAINAAFDLHSQNPPATGDILVFVITPIEAEKCCEQFIQKVSDDSVVCLPLHGKLQADEQAKVFKDNPPNKRKVVFATNCAETSITIPGVRFVVDTGLAKEMRFDPKRNISSLRVYPISKSSAKQRQGRAGRTSPGRCYRLYNEASFQSMEDGSQPEILRVNLGQALLKLMELGVNPLSFDFVESPPKEALDRAMISLCEIGAVEGKYITDVGRWISKLPIEPRQGFLVKLGIAKGIPVEALVVAACGGSELFFRSGTEEEKKAADMKKLHFCHNGGDIITKLHVYETWNNEKEREKGKWCFENSVNAKAMKGTRETINEIRNILKKDLGEDIPFALKLSKESEQILKKLLVKVFKQNVCFYLGHEKVGFFSIQNNQHVQIHPSSVLKPLNFQPKIIVYQQMLQTSRDFVTNVTPVDENEIPELELPFDVLTSYKKIVENMSVALVKRVSVGEKIMKKFIGPLHKNRKQTEEMLNEAASNQTVVLDVNKAAGEIQLFCSKVDERIIIEKFDDVLLPLIYALKKQCIELPVGKTDGVRVVMGIGSSVADVIMPDQFRSIVVKQKLVSDDEPEPCEIEKVFMPFGEVVGVTPLKNRNRGGRSIWGYVTFKTKSDAKRAIQLFDASDNRFFDASPSLHMARTTTRGDFKVKLTWWRRPAKGIAYVVMARPEDYIRAILARTLNIDNSTIFIKESRSKGSHDTTNRLFLRGLPSNITEESIKAEFANLLSVSQTEINDRIKELRVPRDQVETSNVMYDSLYRKIEQEVEKFAEKAAFDISFSPDPRKEQKCIRYIVYLSFKNPDDSLSAINGMDCSGLAVGKYPVKIIPELETSIAIRKNVFDVIKTDMEPLIQRIKTDYPNVFIKINSSRAGNFFVKVVTNDASELALIKALLHALIDADTLECRLNKEITRLFTYEGRSKLVKIGKEVGSLIFVDNRTMTVNIHGPQECRNLSLGRIKQYLKELEGLVEKLIPLKGDGKPHGLMKEIVVQYGRDLEEMKQVAKVKSLHLNYIQQQLKVLGDEPSISKIEFLIKEVSDSMAHSSRRVESEAPDCSVCLCPIETGDMYRLECCGHPYCIDCIGHQVRSAVLDKTFPVVCASENCGEPFTTDDFGSLIRRGCATQRELMNSAISCFVGENSTRFHYCITPDCEMIYEITDEGTAFRCNECQQTMCTACHIQYHHGLTCVMYQAVRNDDTKIDLWLKEDTANRKLCPKCSVAIEKIEGCNHMKCLSCHIHICWVCLETFGSGQACYGHLEKTHGSFD